MGLQLWKQMQHVKRKNYLSQNIYCMTRLTSYNSFEVHVHRHKWKILCLDYQDYKSRLILITEASKKSLICIMKPLKYKVFLRSWWRIKIPYTHNCTRGKHNSNFFPQNTPTPPGKLPICYVPEKVVFPSVVGSFILLLVLVPGYLQHPSINANCMKPRMLCDALCCSSHSPLLTASISLFCTASISWQHMQASTLPKTWQLPHVHLFGDRVNKTGLWTVKFCKYTLSFLLEYINIYIFYRIQPRLRFWKYNFVLKNCKYYTIMNIV